MRTRGQILIERLQSLMALLASRGLTLRDFKANRWIRNILEAMSREDEKLEVTYYKLTDLYNLDKLTAPDLDNQITSFTGGAITRKGKIKASSYIQINGDAGTVVPARQKIVKVIKNEIAYYYLNLSDFTIPANKTIWVQVEAEQEGQVYNVFSGELNTIAVAIPGLGSANNPFAIRNGYDGESNSELIARFEQYKREMAAGTNTAIKSAAKSISGVASVNVSENDPLPGQNYIAIADGNGDTDAETIELVRKRLEGIDISPELNPIRTQGIIYSVRASQRIFAHYDLEIKLNVAYDQTIEAEIEKLIEQQTWEWSRKGRIYKTELYETLKKYAYVADVPRMNIYLYAEPVNITGVTISKYENVPLENYGKLEWDAGLFRLSYSDGDDVYIEDGITEYNLYDATRTSRLLIAVDYSKLPEEDMTDYLHFATVPEDGYVVKAREFLIYGLADLTFKE